MEMNVAKSKTAFRLSPEYAKEWRWKIRKWRDEGAAADPKDKVVVGRFKKDADQVMEVASVLLRGCKIGVAWKAVCKLDTTLREALVPEDLWAGLEQMWLDSPECTPEATEEVEAGA